MVEIIDRLYSAAQTVDVPDVVGNAEIIIAGISIPSADSLYQAAVDLPLPDVSNWLSETTNAINGGEVQRALKEDAETVGFNPRFLLLLLIVVGGMAAGGQGIANGSNIASQQDKPSSSHPASDVDNSLIEYRGAHFSPQPGPNFPVGCWSDQISNNLKSSQLQQAGIKPGQRLYMRDGDGGKNGMWKCVGGKQQ